MNDWIEVVCMVCESCFYAILTEEHTLTPCPSCGELTIVRPEIEC